jgi:hypothetical protein
MPAKKKKQSQSSYRSGKSPKLPPTPPPVLIPRPDKLIYFCDNGVCSVDDDSKLVRTGSTLYLIADGTDVTLRFPYSPFADGRKRFDIKANSFVPETMGPPSLQPFRYTKSCGSCPAGSNDPEIIVGP